MSLERHPGAVLGQERLLYGETSHLCASSLMVNAVSFIREMDVTYITRLEFISSHQRVHLGHIIPGSCIRYRTRSFKGSEAAVSENGIHALKVIIDDAPASLWIGKPHNVSNYHESSRAGA